MGYVIGAVALLKAAKGVEWRPARRRREDVSKRSGEKAHHAAPPAGPTSLPAAARPSSSKPAAEKEPDELPFPEPMPKGDLTQSALRRYDGSNASLPILLAAKGVVYDVTRGRDFYGAGGAYNLFTGRDCSRALAKMSLDPKDVTEDVSDLTADERKVLDDWVVKFEAKYPVVGRVLTSSNEEELTAEEEEKIQILTKNMHPASVDIKKNEILYGDQPSLTKPPGVENRFKVLDD